MKIEEKLVYQPWQATQNQLNILVNIFNHGVTHPSQDQIREIIAQPREYEEIREYSIYCLFQNHGNPMKLRHLELDVTGALYSHLSPFMFDLSWVIMKAPRLLSLFPIPIILEEEEEVTQPMSFCIRPPSTELSLRLSLPDQESP
ncbi:hypothetical protein LR48_Vigan02g097600 [Vigna angularis]|uniref:Uncharacterized protein n=1 Tax=Phaseolus angularis TaxID=3914 RepID=A0A0L9TWF2_PHAAN|nr:hypothetical protein LR48_Vigan02g097600 [Vigna angularis]